VCNLLRLGTVVLFLHCFYTNRDVPTDEIDFC
jgi:hypothetical protein